MRKYLLAFVGAIVIFLALLGASPHISDAQSPTDTPTVTPTPTLEWQRPMLVSGLLRGSWFPSIAVDPLGRVNMAWSVTGEGTSFRELLFFSRWDGLAWTRPADIKDGGSYIVRSALAADRQGMLHLMFDDEQTAAYSRAHLEDAVTARGWTSRQLFSGRQTGYLFDIAIDSRGVLHVVYSDNSPQCPNCALLYYRQSDDDGRSWSGPRKLTDLLVDRRRLQIEIDAQDNIYIAYDNIASTGKSRSGGLVYSTDGGETWSAPVEFFSARGTVNQTAVGVDNAGHVIVVYRVTDALDVFYQYSNDGGRTWGRPQNIPGLFSAKVSTGFDKYDLATDSAGTIYLAAAGRTSAQQPYAGLYILRWDGLQWTKPEPVLATGGVFPEYPTLIVSEGNRLHLAYHVRGADRIYELPDETYKVYYTSATTPAQAITPVPLPTPTNTLPPQPTQPQPTASPTPTRTPLPVVSDVRATEPTSTLPQASVLMALVPVVLLMVVVVALRMLRNRD